MKRTLSWPVWLLLALLIALAACGPAPEPADVAATAAATAEISGPQVSLPGAAGNEPSPALLAKLPAYDPAKIQTTASGLRYIIYSEGNGEPPKPGDTVNAHYSGFLADGTQFDSSLDRGETFNFPLGQGRVIQGWDEGFALLKPGAKAILIIPAELGYGAGGAGTIPPNATLYFDVELVEVSVSVPPKPVAEGDYTTTESGLRYYDFVAGDGTTPQKGEVVSIDYTFWDGNGERYGSSADFGQALSFPLGIERMFPGLDEGVQTMRVGGERQLYIPAALMEGAGLPPETDFIFEIKLLSIAPGAPEKPQELAPEAFTTLDSGIRYADIVVGAGEPVPDGTQIEVNFTAWDGDGKLLDSTAFSGSPFPYFMGSEQFPGWVEGMAGIRYGGQRQISVPADVVGSLGGQDPFDITFEVEVLPAP